MVEKTYHHKNLKVELIENGIKLVEREGRDKLSLRKVAAVCGVSHAAPYSHFQNKEELLLAMQQHITDKLAALLEDTIKTYQHDKGILEKVGEAYVRFFIDNPFYFTFLFTDFNLKIQLSEESEAEDNFKPFVIYRNLLLSLFDKVGFPKEKRQDAVISTWSFVHGLTAMATMNHVYYKEHWKDKIKDLLMMLNCSY